MPNFPSLAKYDIAHFRLLNAHNFEGNNVLLYAIENYNPDFEV